MRLACRGSRGWNTLAVSILSIQTVPCGVIHETTRLLCGHDVPRARRRVAGLLGVRILARGRGQLSPPNDLLPRNRRVCVIASVVLQGCHAFGPLDEGRALARKSSLPLGRLRRCLQPPGPFPCG
jgi:hypothetical protein